MSANNGSGSDVLVAIAHPDDETFVSATLCLLAERGFRIDLVAATDGEGGSRDVLPDKWSGGLGEVRMAELRLAAKMLGVDRVIALQQKDGPGGELAQWDGELVVERFANEIRERRPSLILTHGPRGGYGHAAHCLLHHLVMKAAAICEFEGSCFSFCGAVPGSFFSWHLDDPGSVVVDGCMFHRQRAAALGYHQTQVDYFIQPHFPSSLRKFLSASFGYAFGAFEVGRKRIPIGTPRRFFSKYRREGLVLQKAPERGEPHFFRKYFANDPRVQIDS